MATDHLAPAPVLTPDIQAILKELVQASVTAAIEAANKPKPPTAKELLDISNAQAQRESNAAGVIAAINNERALQLACTHKHSTQAGGGTHCVWIREEDPRSPGYVYCQKCEATIRGGDFDPKGLPCQRDRRAIYDTDLFNRVFQDCGEQTVMG